MIGLSLPIRKDCSKFFFEKHSPKKFMNTKNHEQPGLLRTLAREPSVRFKVQWSPLRLFRLRKNAAQMHGGAFDSGLDFFGAYWLAEIVIHTRRQAKLAVFFHRIGGHGDNIWPFGRA